MMIYEVQGEKYINKVRAVSYSLITDDAAKAYKAYMKLRELGEWAVSITKEEKQDE